MNLVVFSFSCCPHLIDGLLYKGHVGKQMLYELVMSRDLTEFENMFYDTDVIYHFGYRENFVRSCRCVGVEVYFGKNKLCTHNCYQIWEEVMT
jgi:hypothetical protein